MMNPENRPLRLAHVTIRRSRFETLEQLQSHLERYLPENYQVATHLGQDLDGRDEFMISGHDVAGWTLDGYVIPRLASGLIFAHEVDA